MALLLKLLKLPLLLTQIFLQIAIFFFDGYCFLVKLREGHFEKLELVLFRFELLFIEDVLVGELEVAFV